MLSTTGLSSLRNTIITCHGEDDLEVCLLLDTRPEFTVSRKPHLEVGVRDDAEVLVALAVPVKEDTPGSRKVGVAAHTGGIIGSCRPNKCSVQVYHGSSIM
jgi:hypothetical protein